MEIKISKDLRKVKVKDIGNFSFKEVGFILAGCGVGYLTYRLTQSTEISFIPTIIIIVAGFFKPFGMGFFPFLKMVIKDSISPQVYINETDLVFDPAEIEEEYGENVIPSSWDVIQTGTADTNKKKTKRKEGF